ncbi:MAG: radical SAM protein, partial [bacterium]|nr:radical SAM protein [bacterium]
MIQRKPIPISLVFPPQGHFTQPHLAIPCLAAWLKHAGFDDVEQLDLSIEAYDHFLTPEYLSWAKERVADRLPLERFAGAGELPFSEMRAWRAAAESAASADVLVSRIDDAKAVLRGERFYDADAYVPAVRAIYHGLRLASAAHFPSELTPHNFTMGYANDRSSEIARAISGEDQNPFIGFFRERVLPRLVARQPRVLGMSVVYGSQLIPALTLGRLVKEALPDCHVTAGGGFLAYIGEKLMNAPGTANSLDSIIFHEGEGPLAALCTSIAAGADELTEVGSLLWFDRRRGAPEPVRNAPLHPVKLDDAPPPCFDGLPLDKYFSPELAIPYDINRGCYYGECTFCTLPTVIGPGYRTRNARTIASHVMELKERYGAQRFHFITDCMPPGMIRDLPEELIAREADITWWSDARVESKAYDAEGARRLYESGCRKLLFGFETATPRLLKMMKKGQSLKSTAEVARNCAAADISVTFYAMVGFPSETREEARATLDFIRTNADVVREVSLQTFHIDEVAETCRTPEKFGIEIIDDPEADLQLYHDYVSETGMTQEEAAETFEEMMAGFREWLPIFSGDNIFYFMQKGHYFLHLSRDVTPDAFAARCAKRT